MSDDETLRANRRTVVQATGFGIAGAVAPGAVDAQASGTQSADLFEIQVVDAETGDPVPDLTLGTTSALTYTTDGDGGVVLDDPGLMGQTVFFSVSHDEYGVTPDAFGVRGVQLDVEPGGTATVEVQPSS